MLVWIDLPMLWRLSMSIHVLLKEEAVEKCARAIAGLYNQDWSNRTQQAEELVAALVALKILKLDNSPRG